jgi:phage major head subunit gpT-like protein
MYNSPTVLLKGIQARFLRGLATTLVSALAQFIETATSDSNKEQYVLFNHFGLIKEWTDEIEFGHLEDFDYEIKNKSWQNGFLVDRDTLDDSKKTLGNDVEREIRNSLNKWGNFPDKLVTELILAGQTGLAFDKVAFFADSRPALQFPGTTIDNLHTGTGVSQAQITADLTFVMTAMRSWKSKSGDPFNYAPKFVAMIPSHLEWIFKAIKNSTDILSGGQSVTNILKDSFEYVVNDYFSTADNDWYLVNVNSPMKPFIYQTRKTPNFDMKDEKDKKFIKYFSTGRMNVGYGNPVSITKINN